MRRKTEEGTGDGAGDGMMSPSFTVTDPCSHGLSTHILVVSCGRSRTSNWVSELARLLWTEHRPPRPRPSWSREHCPSFMSASTVVVSFHDADILPADVELLAPGKWINASNLHFHSKRLMHKLNAPYSMLVMDPIQVSFMKLMDAEDREEFKHGVGVEAREWILAPVNDASDRQSSGCHWSLILYHTPSNRSLHLDSSGRNCNRTAAEDVARALSLLFGRASSGAASCACPATTPRQADGCSCGVYVMLFTEFVVALLLQAGPGGAEAAVFDDTASWVASMADVVNPQRADHCRLAQLADIELLAAERRLLS